MSIAYIIFSWLLGCQSPRLGRSQLPSRVTELREALQARLEALQQAADVIASDLKALDLVRFGLKDSKTVLVMGNCASVLLESTLESSRAWPRQLQGRGGCHR